MTTALSTSVIGLDFFPPSRSRCFSAPSSATALTLFLTWVVLKVLADRMLPPPGADGSSPFLDVLKVALHPWQPALVAPSRWSSRTGGNV